MQIHLAAANVHDVIDHSAGMCAHVPWKLKYGIIAEIKEEYCFKFYLYFSLLDTTVINFVDNFRHAASNAFSADDEHFLSNDARAAELQLVSRMELKVGNAAEIFDVIFAPRK